MHGLKFRGRPPVLLAKSVSAVANLSNQYAKDILDRSIEIDEEFVNSILSQSVFSWEGRNPKPALDENGNFQVTDLDLLSFLMPLVARGAVIEIPKYQSRRKVVRKENERKVGTTSFGKLTGLTSNKDVLSFSARLFDQSIITKNIETEEESVGAPRNYMLVDCDGHWYDGWNKLVWDPSAKENDFLTKNDLWTGSSVCFEHYVHPNRKQSIFGAPYLLLKMLSKRLTDEASFYRQEVDRLIQLGLKLPIGEQAPYVKTTSEGTTKKIAVETLEMVLDMPTMAGEYPEVPETVAGLVAAYRKQKYLTYTLKPLVQFVIRADEAAFYRFGHEKQFVATWMKGRSWISGYRPPRGRVDWNQMVLSNSMALRYRVKTVNQQVSAK